MTRRMRRYVHGLVVSGEDRDPEVEELLRQGTGRKDAERQPVDKRVDDRIVSSDLDLSPILGSLLDIRLDEVLGLLRKVPAKAG